MYLDDAETHALALLGSLDTEVLDDGVCQQLLAHLADGGLVGIVSMRDLLTAYLV